MKRIGSENTCDFCGGAFLLKNGRQRFCGKSCAQKSWNRRSERQQYMRRYNASYRIANKEHISALNREWDKENRDHRNRQRRLWDAKNHDHVLRRTRAYRENNRDRVRAWLKQWLNRNPEKKRLRKLLSVQKRYAKQKSVADGTVTLNAVMKLYESAKECPYCGDALTVDNRNIDHMEPLSRGGLHGITNLTVCCKSCNVRKSSKPYSVWLASLQVPYDL